MLQASTPACRAYNVVIFGEILLSVLALLLATPLLELGPAQDQSALDRLGAIRLLGGVCGGFHPASGLCGEAPPISVQLHRIDRFLGGAVLFLPRCVVSC